MRGMVLKNLTSKGGLIGEGLLELLRDLLNSSWKSNQIYTKQ